ncbi:MAG: membrane protein insertion efficiency factor YidD, partial [Phycisphaerales bacterium]|nr:membrane protein insertion efficiency factor YidD [Phycisphaerales bacterium]
MKRAQRAGRSRLGLIARVGNWPFLVVTYVYRATLSPFIGGQCRFEPTCSR